MEIEIYGEDSPFSGSQKYITSISGTSLYFDTLYGNGSNLTGISAQFTGGTVTGGTNFTNGLTANTISATTYSNIPTTSSNVGGANGIYYQKVGDDLQFRSLSAGTNVTITSGTTTLTINASGGGSSRITGSTTTTGATPTVVDTIDTLVDNSTNLVTVFVKSYTSGGTQWGIWKRTLSITKVSGTVTVQQVNADVDKQSSGLKAYSLSFTVNSGNVDIYVTGIAATTIDWMSAYEVVL